MSATIELIGVPTDIGAGARGASMGPEALRVAGLIEMLKNHGLGVVLASALARGCRIMRTRSPLPPPASMTSVLRL